MTDVDQLRSSREEKRGEQEARHQAFRLALGKRVRQLRKEKGWNQDEFAIQALLHRAHPNKIENGKIDVRLSTLLNIADALGVPVDELLRL